MEVLWESIPVFTEEYLKIVDITDKVQKIVEGGRKTCF